MKNGRYILITVTACFLCLLVGIFIGRNIWCNDPILPLSPPPISEYPPATELSAVSPHEIAAVPSDAKKGKININTADLSQLMLLPGVGETIGQRILDYRKENGLFRSPKDLLSVKGIGEKKLANMIDYVTTGG